MRSKNWLLVKRRVRFGDCDSANVMHFNNLLKWSHEAWEESIEKYGISSIDIFPDNRSENKIIFPIVNCEASFFCPIQLGDFLSIQIFPSKINNHLFKIKTIFFKHSIKVAEGKIIHCSINPITRTKVSMPDNLEKWIEACNISDMIKEY